MRILIDLTSLADNFSGIERFAWSISRELVLHKEHTFVLLFKGGPARGFDLAADNIETVTLKNCDKLWFNQIRLLRALYQQKADAYLFPAFPEPVLFFSKKIYTAIHDMGCRDCPDTMKFLNCLYFRISYWKSARIAKNVLTVSGFSKKRIAEIEKADPGKICVIYNGIDAHFQRESVKSIREKYKLPEKYILSLSTLEPRKNLTLLLAAYERLASEMPLPELVLAGRKGWKTDGLLSGISEKVKEHIHFTGFIPDEDLTTVYSGAQWFVFPSKYEGFGIPPLEAMACGTPVISSDAASLPEILGDAPVYFESDDLESLMEKMRRFIGSTDEARIKAGKEQAGKYRWDEQADKLLQTIVGGANCTG